MTELKTIKMDQSADIIKINRLEQRISQLTKCFNALYESGMQLRRLKPSSFRARLRTGSTGFLSLKNAKLKLSSYDN
jgi:hypothetical protein